MSGRATRIAAFLAEAGWDGALRAALAGDASFRRYERLHGERGTAVLMDAPPPNEDVRPFVRVARMLAELGLSAPAIHAADPEHGLLLLEDFGDASFARALAEGADPEPLYALATDALIALHRAWPDLAGRDDGLPDYDDARLIDREAVQLLDWYLPAVGRPVDEAARTAFRAAWAEVLPAVRTVPATLVLRDYFPDNLMWLAGRAGVRRCGLLDFQDAVVGPCAYDLLSLLQDARRDVPAEIESAMIQRYLAAFPEIDPAAFRAAYAVLAAQRHTRVLGTFTRLARRDGKPGYLVHIPRQWRMLEAALAHPALAPVKTWLDAHVPAADRRSPDLEVTA